MATDRLRPLDLAVVAWPVPPDAHRLRPRRIARFEGCALGEINDYRNGAFLLPSK